MDVVLMLLGFGNLVVGGDFLVRASVALSLKLNVSKMVIGLTVVSFATSLPELLVSLNAALNGSPSIAINNVVGSNIANIGLVLGITALIGTIYVDKTFYKIKLKGTTIQDLQTRQIIEDQIKTMVSDLQPMYTDLIEVLWVD